ncbi:MAG: hypothetical protein A2114_02295 [Candidatus Vogelbacteria bacterium GWA1_51_14]|uniref:RNA polymerase subunit sigma-24 n=1 Tax=Candidatus Vogelbacteria bacterium GWA1_51_14 TaxID=1802435 RepID=A0A1G2Q9Q7_9BACT|nr:MAG: hypothetical protein A2114_02295 [Candidatus Vogelbacteria bacterium GWA1_51_14]
MSDEKLIALSLKQPELFAEIVARYQAPFMRKATRMLGSRDLAEDVVQDTFVKIYIQASRFDPRGEDSFRAWAHTVFIHTALSAVRKFKRERLTTVHLDNDLVENLGAPDRAISLNLLKDEAMSILSHLPATAKRILTLRFLEGLSYEEIAASEGVSEGAARTRVARARQEFEKVKCSLEP